MPPIATIGSVTSHGGVVITGSLTNLANFVPTARLLDLVTCPIHGINPIIGNVSLKLFVDGNLSAKVGSISACGSVIVSSIALKTIIS